MSWGLWLTKNSSLILRANTEWNSGFQILMTAGKKTSHQNSQHMAGLYLENSFIIIPLNAIGVIAKLRIIKLILILKKVLTCCSVYCGLITSTGFCNQSCWNIKSLIFKVVWNHQYCCVTFSSLTFWLYCGSIYRESWCWICRETLPFYKIIIRKMNHHKLDELT